jgi:hypothetical protein
VQLKHSNGSILGFIDKEKAHYTLTMGEGIKPPMKATLIAFVITMVNVSESLDDFNDPATI